MPRPTVGCCRGAGGGEGGEDQRPSVKSRRTRVLSRFVPRGDAVWVQQHSTERNM
jgi:hypothetical protein